MTLTDQLSAATELVKTASEDAIKAKLLSLQRAGLQWPPGVEAKNAPAIYAFALKRVSLHALKVACERIIQGEEGATMYIPTPPSLAALVRKISAPLYAEVARIRETIETIEENKQYRAPDPVREEAKARVRALVAGVLESAEQYRRETNPPIIRTEAELNRMYRNKPTEGEYFKKMQEQEENEDDAGGNP